MYTKKHVTASIHSQWSCRNIRGKREAPCWRTSHTCMRPLSYHDWKRKIEATKDVAVTRHLTTSSIFLTLEPMFVRHCLSCDMTDGWILLIGRDEVLTSVGFRLLRESRRRWDSLSNELEEAILILSSGGRRHMVLWLWTAKNALENSAMHPANKRLMIHFISQLLFATLRCRLLTTIQQH